MSFGSAENYQGGGDVEVLRNGMERFVKVYNGTGADLARGAVGTLSFKYDTTEGLVAYFVGGFTTQAIGSIQVAVVNNSPLGKNTIADGEYGFVQVGGLCDYCATSGTVNANDQLQGINGGTTLIDQGTNGGVVIDDETCAIACVNQATNVWSVFLLDKECTIAGS